MVSNLKFLLANEIARFATDLIKEQKKEDKKSELGFEELPNDIEKEIEKYVDYNIIDEVFDKGSYLYGAECVDRNLQRSFVDLLSSRITGYENGPKKTKDFLEEKGNYVYLKKSIFDNPKLVKDIVKHIVSLTCRCFDTPNTEDDNPITEDEMNKTLKFAVVDLICKALPHLPIDSMWHTSHKENEDEYSILAPVIDYDNYIEFLNEKEVDHINNKVFGGSPKNSVIGKSHNGNSSKFLRPDYYGEGKGGDDASAKDSGFGASSARSSFNKPKTTFNQPSVSQPDQHSAKKQTSTSKKSDCCIL
ncbi:hypothetical protein [Wolbachia endosymbiont (group B) of Endotricha flammealis]|uniref:hypothetical protein n=1 Tax=Wolbachia endosymbiont (group B) of Endotricha flammealis TaxID=2954005 RepID=UPI00222E4B9D|nr:hypothetical protein [Wolbachia endosymbiont (group B) of Endotricha flammealis]